MKSGTGFFKDFIANKLELDLSREICDGRKIYRVQVGMSGGLSRENRDGPVFYRQQTK